VAAGDGPSSRPAGSSAGGVLIAVYGVVAYLMFVVVFLYLIAFVADADFLVGGVHIVGKSVDRGGIGDGSLTVAAVVIDVALLALFAVQHSVMARTAFKDWLTRVVPPSAERSTYVLLPTFVWSFSSLRGVRSPTTCGGSAPSPGGRC